ncbi:MAG: DNA_ligase_IV_Ku-like [uncultured Solirubrobacteraceae bacterium]|uniref:DNA ligase (ATP) n=1 Tax=uncultured Solirubrobacteraceae bacterium TaxID=1162706 RepID=A0A6J4TK53_9ACTN|nr:MAG: DNA_ligase_IV_Ku-like [uncultured Solirubrobacteraceae bacterium]
MGVPARDRLDEYKRKRDPQRTPEPYDGDGAIPAEDAPRFVVQEHHATRLHWDLRLEHEGVAASWAIPNGIPEDPKENRLAVHTEDHPLEYLEFEGDIPKGEYGAGKMRIWDRGTYETHKFDDDKVEVTFHGERLRGRYGLFPLEKKKGEPAGKDWMIHRMDPAEDPTRQPMPPRIFPMLAKASKGLPPDDGNWAYEIKWDGVRAIAYSEPGRIRFESRNSNDISHSYPELKAFNRALSSHHAILDGEIVAFEISDSHPPRPSFSRLQGRMHVASEAAARRRVKDTPVVYVVFDLLWLNGHSLMDLPYEERRVRLRELELQGPHWQTPDHVVGSGAAVLEASRASGLEGVIAKRLDSPYLPGRRSPCWLKAKNVLREDVVVGGWLPGEGKRRDRIGALLVGVPEAGRLRYAGRVGTGFTEIELTRLAKVLEERPDSPFSGEPKPPRGAFFVEPTRVAEVEFTEWTTDGVLRHPSYKGLREEAPPAAFLDAGTPVRDGLEVRVGERALKVTNLDKVLYPKAGFSKRDIIDYYVAIAPAILPHLEGRPLTRVRFPNGVEGKSFFEKNCPSHRPDWVPTASVPLSDKTVEFCLCNELATLVWLANLAALELHTQMHRAEQLGQPTMMVFDLDPGPPATIVECCRVGLWLHGMFENLGLQAFAKTSGSKGLQVYVPLNAPGVTYKQTKGFAFAVAELLEASEPTLVVSRMKKELRKGKVFIDYSQNDEHKTTVCVYSLRARDRPTVSTPVTWDEVRSCLDSGDPADLVFDARQVVERFAEHGDLYAPVLSIVQEIPSLG